jgi:hypothetical protein
MSENSDPSKVCAQPARGDRRSFRVRFRGSVLVILQLPNRRQVRSAFHMLSATGGTVHLEKPLDEKLEVAMTFHLGNATIRGKAQMLFPMWATQGWLQPFQFTELSEESRQSLAAGLQSFVAEAANNASAGN